MRKLLLQTVLFVLLASNLVFLEPQPLHAKTFDCDAIYGQAYGITKDENGSLVYQGGTMLAVGWGGN